MGYGEFLKDMLRPMGVYRLEGSTNGGELEAVGAALDSCAAALAQTEREMLLITAAGEGLNKVEELLSRRPVTDDPIRRRAALAALLRIGGDSFTPAAINDNLAGCGLNAIATESVRAGTLEVRFPEVPGIPDGFEEMRRIIEDILPCHLAVEYVYWYVTWAMIEAKFSSWRAMEAEQLTWAKLEKLVK